MAGVITTGSHPLALWPGIKAWWGRSYNEHPIEYTALFDVTTSDKNYEEYVQTTGFGLAPQKAQGQGVSYDSEVQGFVTRLTNVAYGIGYIVTHEELEDNLYEVVSKRRAAANAFSMRQTKENVGASVYNNAFSSSYTGADGVSLLNSAHPNTSGGTFSNLLSTAAALSEVAIEDLIIQQMLATNDRGLRINLMPKSLHVHPSNWFEANRILKSVYQYNTANATSGTVSNAVNVLHATNALPEGIKMNHYFTSTTAWFIRAQVPMGTGMIFQERQAISFDMDNDFDTMNAKAKSYERYACGWADPRGLWGTPGA
jgi:hypothetical protein